MASVSRFRLIDGIIFAAVFGAFVCGRSIALADDESKSPKTLPTESSEVAAAVDRMILAELKQAGVKVAPRVRDEDFLRRISFDLAGTVPTPRDVTLFGLEPSQQKRARMVERLVKSDAFARTWASYLQNVVMKRATNQQVRRMRNGFADWLTVQLKENRGWDDITTDILTASGDIRESGATGLIFAHNGQPTELAAETSRIFLGIQLQCANCHDHPTDKWKRDDFHTLAAYFPRISVRPIREDNRVQSYEIVSFDNGGGRRFQPNARFLMARFDRNRDGKLTKNELGNAPFARAFDRLLRFGDKNGDKALTAAEINNAQPPQQPGRGTSEYLMPDLKDPGSPGTQINPVFFVSGSAADTGLKDLARRMSLAEMITATDNPWFARAFVNRAWSEMLGEGFYMPIDDLGPERTARFPKVLELLAKSFVANEYDIRWLFQTIALTDAYQRELRDVDPSVESLPFSAATATRLSADQLYNAFDRVLGLEQSQQRGFGQRRRPGQANAGNGPYARNRGLKSQFDNLFGFDPSTPKDEITGTVPQALFLMNSPLLNNLIRAQGRTRLAGILREFDANDDAVKEIYLLVLAREPSKKELTTCLDYIGEVGNRGEAFEDVTWSLLNSIEFQSKR